MYGGSLSAAVANISSVRKLDVSDFEIVDVKASRSYKQVEDE